MRAAIIISLLLFANVSLGADGGKMPTAQEIIRKLDLKPLPHEGGYYRETYRSKADGLPSDIFGIDSKEARSASTAIYFLVTPDSFSALHRIKSDEVFHFYAGDPVEMIQIDENGKVTRLVLGSDILGGELPQIVVPAGVWQALRLKDGGSWGLTGTTVAPGFEFADLEIAERKQMQGLFPQHSKEIDRFTRE